MRRSKLCDQHYLYTSRFRPSGPEYRPLAFGLTISPSQTLHSIMSCCTRNEPLIAEVEYRSDLRILHSVEVGEDTPFSFNILFPEPRNNESSA